jgi:hypothetical protein
MAVGIDERHHPDLFVEASEHLALRAQLGTAALAEKLAGLDANAGGPRARGREDARDHGLRRVFRAVDHDVEAIVRIILRKQTFKTGLESLVGTAQREYDGDLGKRLRRPVAIFAPVRETAPSERHGRNRNKREKRESDCHYGPAHRRILAVEGI